MSAHLGESSRRPSRNKLIKNWKLPHPPTAVFASGHARAELKLLRERLSAAACAACEHVQRPLEPSTAREQVPDCGENQASQAYVQGGLPTPSDERRLPPEDEKNSESYEGTENQRSGVSDWFWGDPIFVTPSWFSAPPGLALPIRWLLDDWRKDLLYRAGDIKRHPEHKRALSWRGGDVLVLAQRHDGAVADFEKYLSVRDIHGLEEPLNHGLHELGYLCVQYLRTCFCVRNPRTGTSRHSLPA